MSKKSGSGSGAKKSGPEAKGSEAKKEGSGSGSASSSAAKTSPAAKTLPVKPERWGDEPSQHDYPAAASYLSLICDPTEVRRLVTALKAAPIVHYQAKDLLRSSGLALLPTDNFHVASDLAKVARGEHLSPVLLMRGDFRRGVPLTIADGYHRVCASYHLDENAEIPCHLVDHKGPTAVPGFRLGSGVETGTGSDAGSGTGPGGGPGAETVVGADTGAGASTGAGAGAETGAGAGAETGAGPETSAGAGTGSGTGTPPAATGTGSRTGPAAGTETPAGAGSGSGIGSPGASAGSGDH